MDARTLLRWTNITELTLSLVLLCFFLWRRAIREHWGLFAFLAVHAVTEMLSIPVLFFRRYTGIPLPTAYHIYFLTTWISFACSSVLLVCIVYGVYSAALRPFEPLRKLGMIIFKWVAAISVVLAISVSVIPHVSKEGYFVAFVSQIQQTVNVLTLCLLLFVCFALRPLGITLRSRLFGTCFGLGLLSTASMVQSAFISTQISVYSPVYAITGVGMTVCLLIWMGYFGLKEPKRRMVMLPTTSPYFLWNKISEVLGDAPGFVAIAGVTPESFAPGELEGLEVAAGVARERYESPRLVSSFSR